MGSLVAKIFHLICVRNYHRSEEDKEDYFRKGFEQAKAFFDRCDGKVDLKQKTVLDIGHGFGSTCIYMAQNGAARVVGTEIDEDRINFAKRKVAMEYKEVSDIVEFRMADDTLKEQFDIVISKDSFEHYANPEHFITVMKQYLKKDGIMVIGFSPLWKAPYGGHLGLMTKVPWVHLIFPESVIMSERKRFRPDEEAHSFEEVRGGLNKMTLKRYLDIIKKSGLEFVYFKTNVHKTKTMFMFNILKRIPFCTEFFTQNVYSIMCIKT
jgi:2-polyprenyl-3-methyl-5-hydroxy-6-metoxy-1,4-benzoquinol methylase